MITCTLKADYLYFQSNPMDFRNHPSYFASRKGGFEREAPFFRNPSMAFKSSRWVWNWRDTFQTHRWLLRADGALPPIPNPSMAFESRRFPKRLQHYLFSSLPLSIQSTHFRMSLCNKAKATHISRLVSPGQRGV